jgi:hypothetical protein
MGSSPSVRRAGFLYHQGDVDNMESWMEDYIAKNTKKRNESKSESKKAFYKLMNNAGLRQVFQDDRKHRSMEPMVKVDWMNRLLSDPFVTNVKLLRGGKYPLAKVEKQKKEVKLDKPLIVGFATLEYSKRRMYHFFYKTMKASFGDDVRLLMTDTDSLVMEIKKNSKFPGTTWQERLVESGGYVDLDMSVYADDHPAIILKRQKGLDPKQFKGVVRKMKDEEPNDPIAEFVALKAKMYSFVTHKASRR